MMKVLKMIFAILTILFAGLGLFRVLPFELSNPIMLLALSTLLLIRTLEFKRQCNQIGYVTTLFVSVFIYSVVFYILFIG